MKTKLIEVTNGNKNWGKMMLGRFDTEWSHESAISPGMKLLGGRGWTPDHLLVLDIETGEGAVFKMGGLAKHDLEKHRIWVCPMFEPFLEWLYQQDTADLDKLPAMVDLKDAPFEMYGYRRCGPAVIHVLKHGWTLCGMTDAPRNWPPGHSWVPPESFATATCKDCLRKGADA